jgi:prophage regulatory protein
MSQQDTSTPGDSPTKGSSLIREPSVLARVEFSRATLHRMIARGEFPKGIKLGPRMTVWNSADVDRWIQDRIAQGGVR